MSLLRLAQLVKKRRGDQGVRAAAAEIGVSAATLSRVERGHVPDIGTFTKICEWLHVNPNEFLGVESVTGTVTASRATSPVPPAVHFRADQTMSEAAATDLAHLILAAQAEMIRRRL